MTNTLKIGLDLDGVIIDYTSNKIQKAKELGYHLTPEKTPGHIMKTIVGSDHYREIREWIYGDASLDAPPIEEALDSIQKLARKNMLFIISRRKIENSGKQLGLNWLKKYGVLPFIPEDKIFFVPHDELGAKDKVAHRLGIDIFVDDELKILKDMPSVKTRILFDPFNSEPSIDFPKIKKWQELPAMLKLA